MKIKLNWFLSAAAFLIAFIAYLLTVAPDVTFTDAGELASVCTTLGVAHPTGYPFFTILGHLWTKIPLPVSPVHSLNILAAFLTALAIFVFYHINYLVFNYLNNQYVKPENVHSKSGRKKKNTQLAQAGVNSNTISVLALASSLIFAFSRTVWQQSNSIEVYSLHLLLINLIILCMLKGLLPENKNYKLLFLAAFLTGISFSNHLTTLLILPAILFIFFKFPGEQFDFSKNKFRLLFWLIIPFVLGLSFYLYLPIRSMAFPDFNWGWVSRGWDKFIYHVSGKQYQLWMFSDSEAFNKNLGIFISSVPNELALVGIFTFFYGLYRCFIASRELFWFLIILIISSLLYTLNYSIHDINTYFLTTFMSIALLCGIGMFGLLGKMPKTAVFFLLLPLFNIYLNYSESNRSNDYLVPEYTRILGDNLQPNAILISSQWDYLCSAFWYKQKVEGYRTDVMIIEKELIRRTWYLGQLKKWYPKEVTECGGKLSSFLEQLEPFESGEKYNPIFIQQRFIDAINCFIDRNYGKRPIYLTLEILQSKEDSDIGAGYEKIPEGFAFRLEKSKNPFPVSVDKINVDKFLKSFKSKDDHLVGGIVDLASFNILNIGRYAYMTGQNQTAKKAFELALRVNPDNEAAKAGVRELTK